MHGLLSSEGVWVAISFVIFAAIAYRLGRSALIGKLDARIREIRTQIDTAENLRIEAQELLAQYQRRQRDALKDAEQIIESAKASAAKIRKQAESELEELLARREQVVAERIARLQHKALQEIQDKAADLAVAAAGRLIEERLDKKTDAVLVDESISGLSSRLVR